MNWRSLQLKDNSWPKPKLMSGVEFRTKFAENIGGKHYVITMSGDDKHIYLVDDVAEAIDKAAGLVEKNNG